MPVLVLAKIFKASKPFMTHFFLTKFGGPAVPATTTLCFR